ncbi:MAG: LptF/LptG family permease [Bacteroidetes bacterium]|nr:LptF/LptG family permease [Bacteroidota bacterium]
MKTIDRYILKKYFTTFFFAIFLFTVIAVAVDISEKTDDFVKSGLGAMQIIQQYYIAFVPYIIALLFPLFVFISVIFFTSKMAGNSEVIAIIAGGSSYNRFLRPYLIGGLSLGLLLLLMVNFVIPKANAIRTTFESIYVNPNSSYDPLLPENHSIYFRIDSFTYAGIRNYDTATKSGSIFFMNRVKGVQLVYSLRAENISWDTAQQKWVLKNVFERTINGLKETVHVDRNKTMNFNFQPFDLSRDDYAKDKLATPALTNFIQLEELRGSENVNALKIERYRRLATPLAVVILTLIGALIASKRVRGGSGAHLALGFVIAAIFILMDRFSTIFSTKGNLPPEIAAWIPDLVFLVVTYFLYKKAAK